MNYFTHCTTLEDVKSEYRRLAKIHHPDLGGDTATMQALNAQYHTALKNLDGSTSSGSDGNEHTYRYNAKTEQAVMDKLAELLAIHGTFEVHMIGTWLWVMGDTKPIKESLKNAGCSWHSKRICWYWRPSESRHYGKASPNGLAHLAERYGVSSFQSSETDRNLAHA